MVATFILTRTFVISALFVGASEYVCAAPTGYSTDIQERACESADCHFFEVDPVSNLGKRNSAPDTDSALADIIEIVSPAVEDLEERTCRPTGCMKRESALEPEIYQRGLVALASTLKRSPASEEEEEEVEVDERSCRTTDCMRRAFDGLVEKRSCRTTDCMRRAAEEVVEERSCRTTACLRRTLDDMLQERSCRTTACMKREIADSVEGRSCRTTACMRRSLAELLVEKREELL